MTHAPATVTPHPAGTAGRPVAGAVQKLLGDIFAGHDGTGHRDFHRQPMTGPHCSGPAPPQITRHGKEGSQDASQNTHTTRAPPSDPSPWGLLPAAHAQGATDVPCARARPATACSRNPLTSCVSQQETRNHRERGVTSGTELRTLTDTGVYHRVTHHRGPCAQVLRSRTQELNRPGQQGPLHGREPSPVCPTGAMPALQPRTRVGLSPRGSCGTRAEKWFRNPRSWDEGGSRVKNVRVTGRRVRRNKP